MLQETTSKQTEKGGAYEAVCDLKEIAQALELLRSGIGLHAFQLKKDVARLEKHLTECQANGT
jgi:hypothetical protein